MKAPVIKGNIIDRIVSYVNPIAGARRLRARLGLADFSASGYNYFGSGKQSMLGAFASPNSAQVDTGTNISPMRASSRDMYMNAPIATGALKRCRTNIVGYGLSVQARIDRGILGMSDDEAEKWEQKTEREFNFWANSKNCDASRTQNFFDLQRLVIMSKMLSGDCFALPVYKARPGWPYELCFKILEADMVSNPLYSVDSDAIAGGVKLSGDGEPEGYWISKTHPGGLTPSFTWDYVPAYNSAGRRNVYHIFERDRPGQVRGVPLLAPVIESLKMITRLSESELMAAVVTSFFTAFIKSSSGADIMADGLPASAKVTDPTDTSKLTYEMAPGSIIGLAEGEDVTMADPKRPNGAFEPFFQAIVKAIGSAIEIPAELLLLNFTASYSASRAALLEAWKFFNTERAWMATESCAPCYEEWLSEAVMKGFIDAPGFFSSERLRAAWSGSAWSGPGQGQLDPVRETTAMVMKITNNLSTHSKEVASIDGDSWDSMILQRSRENKVVESHGLKPIVAGAAVPSEEDDDTETDDEKTVPADNKPVPPEEENE